MSRFPKNLLIITADEMRADCTGFGGSSDARTPHLDALASRSTMLANHFTTFPKCVPARCSMLTARHTPTGLQRHGQHETEEGCIAFHDSMLTKRLGKSKDAPREEKIAVGAHHLAEAETGWDFNPRFSGRCLDHNPADLNGLLHTYETFLGTHAASLGWDDTALWLDRAAARRERMTRLLWSGTEGWFMD